MFPDQTHSNGSLRAQTLAASRCKRLSRADAFWLRLHDSLPRDTLVCFNGQKTSGTLQFEGERYAIMLFTCGKSCNPTQCAYSLAVCPFTTSSRSRRSKIRSMADSDRGRFHMRGGSVESPAPSPMARRKMHSLAPARVGRQAPDRGRTLGWCCRLGVSSSCASSTTSGWRAGTGHTQ